MKVTWVDLTGTVVTEDGGFLSVLYQYLSNSPLSIVPSGAANLCEFIRTTRRVVEVRKIKKSKNSIILMGRVGQNLFIFSIIGINCTIIKVVRGWFERRFSFAGNLQKLSSTYICCVFRPSKNHGTVLFEVTLSPIASLNVEEHDYFPILKLG